MESSDMPGDEIKPRSFPSSDKDFDRISKQMEDHDMAAKQGADSTQAHEQVPVAH